MAILAQDTPRTHYGPIGVSPWLSEASANSTTDKMSTNLYIDLYRQSTVPHTHTDTTMRLEDDGNIRVQGFDVNFDDARAFAARADYTALAHSSTNLDLSKLIIAMAIYRFYNLNLTITFSLLFTGCTL